MLNDILHDLPAPAADIKYWYELDDIDLIFRNYISMGTMW